MTEKLWVDLPSETRGSNIVRNLPPFLLPLPLSHSLPLSSKIAWFSGKPFSEAALSLCSTSAEREAFFTNGLPQTLPRSGLCLAPFKLNVRSSASHYGQGDTAFHWPSWTTCPCLESCDSSWLTPTQITRTDWGERSIQRKTQMLVQIKRGMGTGHVETIPRALSTPLSWPSSSQARNKFHLCVPVSHGSRVAPSTTTVGTQMGSPRAWGSPAYLPPEIVQPLPSSSPCVAKWTSPSHGLYSHPASDPALTLLILQSWDALTSTLWTQLCTHSGQNQEIWNNSRPIL